MGDLTGQSNARRVGEIMENKITMVILFGRNFVGKLERKENVLGGVGEKLLDTCEMMNIIGPNGQMAMVAILLGDMDLPKSTEVLITISKKSNYYKTYYRAISDITLP